MKSSSQPKEGYKEIFCKKIVKNGKVVYPKNSKFFHFYVKDKAVA